MKEKKFIELKIVKPTKVEIFQVEWISVQSPAGNFIVGLNHVPLVSRLKYRGKLIFKPYDKEETEIDTYVGFFKIKNNKALVILNM